MKSAGGFVLFVLIPRLDLAHGFAHGDFGECGVGGLEVGFGVGFELGEDVFVGFGDVHDLDPQRNRRPRVFVSWCLHSYLILSSFFNSFSSSLRLENKSSFLFCTKYLSSESGPTN